METLEQRQLLAVGPQLIGVQPDGGARLVDGAVRQVSPRELVFRFDESQAIDPSTLQSIQITGSGGDGTFVVPTIKSDFGSVTRVDGPNGPTISGGADILLRGLDPARDLAVTVSVSAAVTEPTFTVNTPTAGATEILIEVPTDITAGGLVDAINAAPDPNRTDDQDIAQSLLTAELLGGLPSTPILVADNRADVELIVQDSGDVSITPSYLAVGEAPRQNEVIARFAEPLPEDRYRIEVFGFDDPDLGIVGLRNSAGDLLVPRDGQSRQETLEFSVQLGAKVTAVVPQPVVRLSDGSLQQRRNEVVVYLNDDDLFIENDANGQPTARSAENPRFYKLILTGDSVSNLDDQEVSPTEVVYNPSADTLTLIFESYLDQANNPVPITDLVDLFEGAPEEGTFRLRIGTAEDIPIAPRRVDLGGARATTSLGTADATLLLESTTSAQQRPGTQIRISIKRLSGSDQTTVEVDGNHVTVLVSGNQSVSQVASAINGNASAADLVSASVQGNAAASVPAGLASEVIDLLDVGGTFDTAGVVGTFDVADGLQSVRLTGSIDPIDYRLELPGGNDDLAHRDLPSESGNEFEQHVNDRFGPDITPGVTLVPYNFQQNYGTNASGQQLINAITQRQKDRVREGLDLWGRYLGIEFVETEDAGITVATGDLAVLDTSDPDVVLQAGLDFGVRIDDRLATDPAATNALLVLDGLRLWNDRFGEDYFRTSLAGLGALLGLEIAGDLPTSTLMALSSAFLNGTSGQEPVFPGNFDILHGRHLWRPEGGDVDLYQFTVDLDDPNKLGSLTAETFAERLLESSSLDTTLTLYKRTQARVITDLGLGGNFQLELEARKSGAVGNRVSLQVIFSPNGGGLNVEVDPADPNAILVFVSDLQGTTFQQVADAINNHAEASELVEARLVISQNSGGANDPTLGSLPEDTPPIFLSGGSVVQLSRNDDYFSEDSFLRAEIGSGTYFIGVAASGNDHYDPTNQETGFGGVTEGQYELLLQFRPQIDETDVIRDLDGNNPEFSTDFRLPGTRLDGDGDGVVGGVFNFWFQTRNLERQMEFTAGGQGVTEGQRVVVTDFRGITRTFEFTQSGNVGATRLPVVYAPGDSPEQLALSLADAINNSALLVDVTQDAARPERLLFSGERVVQISANFTNGRVVGKTIFVDKVASPQSDGSLDRPFNNISNPAVPNAFTAALPGDIVRIIGNGGSDQFSNPSGGLGTVRDNFAYEFGFDTVQGNTLDDGTAMEVPAGVTVMVDAGSIFKLRRSYVGVGSTSLLEDRSGSVLQVLGTPKLVERDGSAITGIDGRPVDGEVFFTSWLDESIGFDRFGPSTTPSPGDWGGIQFKRDLDAAEGRPDLEDDGIFMQYVGNADIRYGGSKDVVIDGVQQIVNPIEIVDYRPTIIFNEIRNSADAAMSATPDSFVETRFTTHPFQVAGAFTPDYTRVGPEIQGNQLFDNSVNGIFVRADTPAAGTLRELTVAGRFDDTDIVHVIAENVVVAGTPGGGLVSSVRADVTLVTSTPQPGGELPAGSYTYRLTYVDRFGNESLPSDATPEVTVSGNNGSVLLSNLPPAESGFVSRRLYRQLSPNGPFELVATLDSSDFSFRDVGQTLSISPVDLDITSSTRTLARTDASLVVDPGTVVKLEGSRIELQYGTQLLAEGLPGREVIFTSLLDDRYGAGGEFDTDNDGMALVPVAGNWGGVYAGTNANISLDNAVFAFAGGLTRIEGTFKAFNPIELQQATARITNTVFEDNADGQGGQGPAFRLGRLDNTPATIFARGTQPIIVGNTFVRGGGSIIDIDANSMISDIVMDAGRQTGSVDRIQDLDDNHGPMVRRNRIVDNQINAMEIRGRDQRVIVDRSFRGYDGREFVNSTESITVAQLTTESIWDDADIVHAVFQSIEVGNFHSEGGLRLESRPGESLVVKFAGSEIDFNGKQKGPASPFDDYYGTGLTATGEYTDIADRIGGILQVIGRPGAPVVLTSLADDTVGAGLQPDGTPHTDTNNDRFATRPEPNDWRGVLLDQHSHDRNIYYTPELESPTQDAPGPNARIATSQFLGDLAADPMASDENRVLGFEVAGFISEPTDIDIYSFTAAAGTEIFFDIDETTFTLDTVIELLDANGVVIARSDNSTAEQQDPSLLDSRGVDRQRVGSLQQGTELTDNFNSFGLHDEFGTVNPRDAGFRVVVPGVEGARSTYHVRVRSAAIDPGDVEGGLSKGQYHLHIRMQEEQEVPGSTVRYADIRYANIGVNVRGLPAESPLLGEAQEDEQASLEDPRAPSYRNDQITVNPLLPGNRPQYIGNLLQSDRAAISVGGTLQNFGDVDFYQFEVNYDNIQNPSELLRHSTVFDVDYADGIGRPDTNISVFYDPDVPNSGLPPRLVLFGQDSNVADDQDSPLALDPVAEDFIRGSLGAGDPFIGSVELPEGFYYVAVTESGQIPSELANPLAARREPVNSVVRIADDKVQRNGGSTAAPPLLPRFIDRTLPAGWSTTTTRGNDPGHAAVEPFDGSRPIITSANQQAVQGEGAGNDTFQTATDLDRLPLWSLAFNDNIGDTTSNTSQTIPHTTINASFETNDDLDVFQFEVTQSLSQLIVDVDFGEDASNPNDPDSVNVDMYVIDEFGFAQFPFIAGNIQADGRVDIGETTWGQGGSADEFDPFAMYNLTQGTYFLAMVQDGTFYDQTTNSFQRDINRPNGSGTYTVQVSLENHPAFAPPSQNQSFYFNNSTPNTTLSSNAFDLEGYVAEDKPRLYFTYYGELGGGSLQVQVTSDQNPGGTVLATSNPGGGLSADSQWRQSVLDLGAFAGHTGIRANFIVQGANAAGEGLYLDDFIVGFAERGEMITGATAGAATFTGASQPGSITSGQYQLEIRPGSSFGDSVAGGNLQLQRSFDTNQRQSDGITIVAPAGYQLSDGNFFELNDGATNIVFEFDDTGSPGAGQVQSGRIRVPFNQSMTAAGVAQQIISVINSAPVQAVLNIEAASSSGIDGGSTLGDARINLHGLAAGDFQTRTQGDFEVVELGVDPADPDYDQRVTQTTQRLVGPGITLVNTPVFGVSSANSIGTFRGGRDIVGFDSGVIVSNGTVNNANGPNLDDNFSSTASGTADDDAAMRGTGDVESEFAVSTSDHSSIEFEFTVDQVGELFLDLVFASEEYTENVDGDDIRDIAAIFIDDGNGPVPVAVETNPEVSTEVYGTDSTGFTPNDPRDGGKLLNKFGYDGITRILRARHMITDTAPTYTLRIVMADEGADGVDSAIFLRDGSLTTQPSPNPNLAADAEGRIVFDTDVVEGIGDENVRRQQGQVRIENNFISDAKVYGVWTNHGEREQVPADFRNFGLFIGSAEHPYIDQPRLGPTHQGAVRNLRAVNDIVEGGLSTGLVIQNNVIDQAGVAGVQIDGQTNPLVVRLPEFAGLEDDVPDPADFRHWGDYIPDGLVMVVDAKHVRVAFEFEDIGGGNAPANPASGSTVAGGDGVTPGHIPIYYRQDGVQYNSQRDEGHTQHEVAQAIRDAINGSLLVTNGFVQLVDVSVGGDLSSDSISDVNTRGSMTFRNPAVYIEGAVGIYFTTLYAKSGLQPFVVEEAPIYEAPQPFTRVVNNTIYGADGRRSETVVGGLADGNDFLGDAIDTRQGRSHNPAAYTTTAQIGDSQIADPLRDVDFYSFTLDVGDRVRINVDTAAGGPDTALRLFNSSGESLLSSGAGSSDAIDNAAAPGEALGIDPYLDYTALKKDTYYVAISGSGNVAYDPFSLDDRVDGRGTGDYNLSLEVLAPRSFVITAQDAATLAGETFTISQIPDFAGTQNNSRTFEFVIGGGGATGNNIPINLAAGYRQEDVARAIAAAINGVRDITFFRTSNPPLPNHENGNGPFNVNGPITRVEARALGSLTGYGIDPLEITATDPFNFSRWASGIYTTGNRPPAYGPSPGDSRYERFIYPDGLGHDRIATDPVGAFSDGAGTSELYVVIENAASITTTSNTLLLDPQPGSNYDQVLPETGINITEGASPTLLNNVIVNTYIGVVDEVTRFGGYGDPENRGFDLHVKQNDVIVGGSAFQGIDGRVPVMRNTFNDITQPSGLELTPSNVNFDNDDFNVILNETQNVMINPAGDSFIPGPTSFIIDSAIDSLLERDDFAALKSAVGINPSPILAPERDATGQLRSDNPNVATPSGLGGNVFKDRGALDRADFTGPNVSLVRPLDNDADGRDLDSTLSVVKLASGQIAEFHVQLSDTADGPDPFPGSGISDASVVGPTVPGLRARGAVVTLFENGRLLEEGVDYTFRYNATTDTIILTSLAGVFRSDSLYEIELNHRDQFVVRPPAGPEARDGQTLQIRDTSGGLVTFEFETGFQLFLPADLTLTIPRSGGGSGGVRDGDRVTVEAPTGQRFTFEFDSNGTTLSSSIPVPFRTIDGQQRVTDALITALQGQIGQVGYPISDVRDLGNGEIFMNMLPGTEISTGRTAIRQESSALVLQLPAAGPAAVADGETLTIVTASDTVTLEFDNDGQFGTGNIPIFLNTLADNVALQDAIRTELVAALGIQPVNLGTGRLDLQLSSGQDVSTSGPSLSLVGIAERVSEGDGIVITTSGGSQRFEFDNDGITTGNAIAVPFDSNATTSELADRLSDAINNNNPFQEDVRHVGDGVIILGGQPGQAVVADAGSDLQVVGEPGLTSNSSLTISGPVVLTLPLVGGAAISDGDNFSVFGDGRLVNFEFDLASDNSLNDPTAIPITYTLNDDLTTLAQAVAAAIDGEFTGITATASSSGRVLLAGITDPALVTPGPGSQVNAQAGNISDGEQVRISDGTRTVVFEFEDATRNNGVQPGTTAIVFDPNGTKAAVAQSLASAINNSSLSLTATVNFESVLLADATPRTTIDLSNAVNIQLSGVAGGGVAVPVINSGSFTREAVKLSFIEAVNNLQAAGKTNLIARDRGGDTFFLENAFTVDSQLPSFFLSAIEDKLGNPLKANRLDDSAGFTIILPGTRFDFGDAPDPYLSVPGRYPTLESSDGARHVVTTTGPLLGTLIDAEPNAQPQQLSNGDDESLLAFSAQSPAGTMVFTVQQNASELGPAIDVGSTLDATAEGATITIDNGFGTVTFELDSDGQFDEDNIRVGFLPGVSSPEEVAANVRLAIESSALQLAEVTQTLDGAGELRRVQLTADDEDALELGDASAPTNVIVPGRPTEVNLTVTGTGVLDAWIDFNGDGDWSDPNEQLPSIRFTNPPNVSSVIPLSIELPDSAGVPSAPFGVLASARFRVSSIGNLEPTGLALDGEVEDHVIRVVNRTIPAAPDTDNDGQPGPLVYATVEDSILSRTAAQGVLSTLTRHGGNAQLAVYNPSGQFPLVLEEFDNDGNLKGTVELNEDGSFVFTPAPDFFGVQGNAQFDPFTFSFRAIDESLRSATADNNDENGAILASEPIEVQINVDPINDAPFREDLRQQPNGGYDVFAPGGQRIEVNEDTQRVFQISDIIQNLTTADLNDGDNFVPGPQNEIDSGQQLDVSPRDGFSVNGGTVLRVGGEIRYTPAPDYVGTDTFVLDVTDTNVPSGQVPRTIRLNVQLQVNEANDAPIVGDVDLGTFNEASGPNTTVVTFTRAQLLANASDPDGDNLQIESVDGNGQDVVLQAGGDVVFTVPVNANGTFQFDFTVVDDNPEPRRTTARATFFINPTQDAPLFSGPATENLDLTEDGPGTILNLETIFSDPDSDPLSFSVNFSDAGIFEPISTSDFPILRLRPAANQNTDALPGGRTTVQVTAFDGQGNQTTKTYAVAVVGVEDEPVIQNPIADFNNVPEDDQGNILQPIDLTNVFNDVDGQQLTFTASSNNTQLINVSVVGNSLVFDLVENASGSATITVRASDGTTTVTDQFNVIVTPINDPPTARPDNYTLPRGGTLTVNDPQQGLLGNDSDPDGDAIASVRLVSGPQLNRQNGSIVTGPNAGTLTLNTSDGTFTFEYAGGDTGETVTFVYEVEDATGLKSQATAILTIGDASKEYQNPVQTSEEFAFFQANPDPVSSALRRDVSGDGSISPIDALLVINLLNRFGGPVGIEDLDSPPPPYYDVNGDALVTPIDANIVITWLNRRTFNQLGEGEAEQAAAAVPASVSQDSVGLGIPQEPVAVGGVASPKPLSSGAFEEADFGNDELDVVVDAISERAESEDDEDAFDAALEDLLSSEI